MVHLVTGFAGEAHVASEDDGSKQAAIVGSGRYVANIGSEFEARIKSNNLIRIADGDLFNQGRHIRIPPNSYEEVTISNGSQGVNRNDLIVMRYEKSTSNGIETAALKVIKGTAGSTAKDPEYTQGDILAGEYVDEFPLYRVRITGLSIAAVEPMFDILLPMAEMYSRLNGKLNTKTYTQNGITINKINDMCFCDFSITFGNNTLEPWGGDWYVANITDPDFRVLYEKFFPCIGINTESGKSYALRLKMESNGNITIVNDTDEYVTPYLLYASFSYNH